MSDTLHEKVSASPLEEYLSSKPTRPASLLEAFANTAKALQQFGLERIRIVGLSKDCTAKGDNSADGGVRVVTEQEFMREFVFLSRPCVILDAIEDWPAMQKWRNDRYVFDLDNQLPSEEEVSDAEEDEEDDDDSCDGDEKRAEAKEIEKEKRAADVEEHAPRPRGPKKVTVALTPNGRADAVTYAIYDAEDVPEELRDAVCSGPAAKKTMIKLDNHPLLSEADKENPNIFAEKIFMYAPEVKVTLPELYQLLQQSPVHRLPNNPIFIDMRSFKQKKNDLSSESGSGPASSPQHVVAYAQLQNNCLNTEYKHLHNDIRTNIEEFGTRVFGETPEAANVWLGVPSSVSSMHQDWVENLYPVVRGVKEFLLIPPWEGYFVPKPDAPSASFALDMDRSDRDSLTFAFKPFPEKDGTVVPWMDFDFTAELLEEEGAPGVLSALQATIDDNNARKPRLDPRLSCGVSASSANKKLKELHPLVARVAPGETLYLPAMWLHRVGQLADEHDKRARARHAVEASRHKATSDAHSAQPLPLIAAVNYWYNMNFGNPAVVMLREFGLLL